jgi:hypothetical protein
MTSGKMKMILTLPAVLQRFKEKAVMVVAVG